MVEFSVKPFKSILNRMKTIDSWFWNRYTLNPYNGCQFGCIYCDSRSQKYHLEEDFENKIIVKSNIRKLLENQILKSKKFQRDVVAIGGTTDPYQPAERKYNNTRQCLEFFSKYKFPVLITTKSDLVLRDTDLLDFIGQETWASVSITITTMDREKSKFLEKNAPNPLARLKTLTELKKRSNHIQTGITYMPIIPYLTDGDEELENVMRSAKNAKVDYVLFGGGVTLRDKQAVWFLNHIKEKYPELIPKYENLYKFSFNDNSYNGSYTPNSDYLKIIHNKFLDLCHKYGISYRMKRYIPDDYRQVNYVVAAEILNQIYDDQLIGKTRKNLFWIAQNIQNLKESIHELSYKKQLHTLGNLSTEYLLILDQLLKKYPQKKTQGRIDDWF